MILIIEDNVELAKVMAQAAESLGYVVCWANTGYRGIGTFFLNYYDVDLVLTDYDLGDITGFDICEIIKRGKEVPVVLVTASTKRWETHPFIWDKRIDKASLTFVHEFESALKEYLLDFNAVAVTTFHGNN